MDFVDQAAREFMGKMVFIKFDDHHGLTCTIQSFGKDWLKVIDTGDTLHIVNGATVRTIRLSE